jgi:leucyl aminopeptidase
MTRPPVPAFQAPDAAAIAGFPGRIAVFAEPGAGLSPAARRLDRAMRGALARAAAGTDFARLGTGEGLELAFPAGLAARAVHLLRLGRRTAPLAARKAGAEAGKACGADGLMILADRHPDCA